MTSIRARRVAYGRGDDGNYSEYWQASQSLRPEDVGLVQVTAAECVAGPKSPSLTLRSHVSPLHESADTANVGNSPSASLLLAELGVPETMVTSAQTVATAADQRGDAAMSDLIAMGNVYDKRLKKQVGVLASITGVNRGVIQFNIMERSIFTVADSENSPAFVSNTVGEKTPGFFFNDRGPIQQLKCSHSLRSEESCFAARTSSCISIFQPFLAQEAGLYSRRADAFHRSESLPSRLNPGFVADIHCLKSLEGSLMDFSFNAWNTTQMAAITSKGQWLSWRLEGLTSHSPGRCEFKPLHAVHKPSSHDFAQSFDGWGRVMWTSTGQAIVTARRESISIHNAREPNIVNKMNYRNCPSWAGEWLLDLQACPQRENTLVALAMEKLYLIDIKAQQSEVSDSTFVGCIVSSIIVDTPLRGLSLKLKLMSYGDYSIAILHSFKSTMMTTVSFHRSNEYNQQFSVGCRREFDFLLIASEGQVRESRRPKDTQGIQSLIISPSTLLTDNKKICIDNSPDNAGDIIRLFTMSPDLKIFSCLAQIGDMSTTSVLPEIDFSRSRSSSLALSAVSATTSFILDDEEVPDDVASDKEALVSLMHMHHTRDHSNRLPRLVDLGVLSLLHAIDSKRRDEQRSIQETAEAWNFVDFLSTSELEAPPNPCLFVELRDFAKFIDSFDSLPDTFNTVIRQAREGESITLQADNSLELRLTPVPSSALSSSMLNTLVSSSPEHIYDVLVSRCMVHLNDKHSSHARVVLNRVLRLIATQLFGSLLTLQKASQLEALDVTNLSSSLRSKPKTKERDEAGGGSETKLQAHNQGKSRVGSNAKSRTFLSSLGVLGTDDEAEFTQHIENSWTPRRRRASKLSAASDIDSLAESHQTPISSPLEDRSSSDAQIITSASFFSANNRRTTEDLQKSSPVRHQKKAQKRTSKAIGQKITTNSTSSTQSATSSAPTIISAGLRGDLRSSQPQGSQSFQPQTNTSKSTKKKRAGFR